PWRTGGTSVPIAGEETPVLVMGRLRNRLRRFVDRSGLPLATGFFAIGDAAYHSNPIYGRGAPSGLVQAALLDEALERHPRGLLRVFNMLDPPEQLLRDPELVLRALPVLARVLRGDEPAHLFPRVERDAVLARLGS